MEIRRARAEVEDDSRVVGAIGAHPTGATGVLNLGMSILPEHRGQGWGRKLLDAALAAAAAEGVRKITLEVLPDNGRAIALYAAAGFEVEGLKRNHYLRKDGSALSVADGPLPGLVRGWRRFVAGLQAAHMGAAHQVGSVEAGDGEGPMLRCRPSGSAEPPPDIPERVSGFG